MSDLVFLGFGTFLFILTAALREPAGVFEFSDGGGVKGEHEESPC